MFTYTYVCVYIYIYIYIMSRRLPAIGALVADVPVAARPAPDGLPGGSEVIIIIIIIIIIMKSISSRRC